MPPTKEEDIEKAVENIMSPFYEGGKDEDGEPNRHPFWDFYRIGGRYAGVKFEASLDPLVLESFRTWLEQEKITVSGFQAGKQEISPADQIPKVDAKWNELFPNSPLKKCPLFAHANDNRAKLFGDIMRLGDMPEKVAAAHVIIACPSFVYDDKTETGTFTGELEASSMVSDSLWNGVSHVDSKWDGLVLTAVNEHKQKKSNARADVKHLLTPNDEWLVVTVDYHT